MRTFDSAKDAYLKFNEMVGDLAVVKDNTSNGFFKRQNSRNVEDNSKYSEIQKGLIFMNQIREQREMINNAASTA